MDATLSVALHSGCEDVAAVSPTSLGLSQYTSGSWRDVEDSTLDRCVGTVNVTVDASVFAESSAFGA